MEEESSETSSALEARELPPVTPLQRALALIALLALLASGAVTSWWVLTGQVDFARERAHAAPVVLEVEEGPALEVEVGKERE